VNLETFDFSQTHRRGFFGLLIGFMVEVEILNPVAFAWEGLPARLEAVVRSGAVAALSAIPGFTTRRWGHWGAVIVAAGLIGWPAIHL